MHWVSWDKMCLEKENGGLGFRDLEKFNQALLAKQGWRLLSRPESLCARVLCSRYYPDGNFLSAKLGSRPSYAWRSCLFGREVLEKGLRRSVGSGEEINVWLDKWLFEVNPKAPMRKALIFDLDLRVCDLINSQTKTWDRGKLEENFFQQDIELILKLKPAWGDRDAYEWVHTRCGAYSVKSGYWLACSLDKSQVRQEAMAQPSMNMLRNKIWKVKTAPKIRIFMWKALSNALSVTEELLARGLKVDSRCQRCGFQSESINHVMFVCPIARRVWAQVGFPFPPRGFEHRSLLENFDYLLGLSTRKDVPDVISRMFPWILWFLWKNRNVFVFEGKEFDVDDTVNKIHEEANQWFEVNKKGSRDNQGSSVSPNFGMSWRGFSAGMLKCNVGIAWSKRKNMAGSGWIVRNERGEVVLHSRRAFSGINSLIEAKHVGLLWAIESMGSHKLENVCVEIEAPELVGVVERPGAWPSFRAYGRELHCVLGNLKGWKLKSIPRGVNRIAFLIARSVTMDMRFQSYVARGEPNWLREIVEKEKRR